MVIFKKKTNEITTTWSNPIATCLGGLLNSYLHGQNERLKAREHFEHLAWHGASADLHQQALQGGGKFGGAIYLIRG